ncbi:MAG TPA: LysM domain-containing protein [Candidatus Angelobacter sp.]
MSFDDPEEKQDETTMPQLRPQKSVYPDESDNQQTLGQQNQGGNPEVVKGLMEMMKQYRTPPGPNGEYYKRVYPPMPEPEPEPTSGEKIMALRYPEGSPERERFWKPEKTFAEELAEVIRPGRNLPPPSRLQIVKDPNAIGGGPPWPQESQSIFRHFYPGMSEAELRPERAEGRNQLPQSGMTSDRSQGVTSSGEPFGARSNLMQFATQGASAPAAGESGTTATSQPQHSGGYANEPRLEDYLLGHREPFAGLSSETADYMKGREESFRGTREEKWESLSARPYTEDQLRTSYGEQQQPKKSVAGGATGVTATTTAAGGKVGANNSQSQPTWYGDGKPGRGQKNPSIPPVTGTVGSGQNNNPADVKWVQQLLNAAIDNDDLSGPKVPEDGKVSDRMLQLIGEYQSAKRLPREVRLDHNSQTIKELAANPLFDPRWNKYDDIIKKEVNYCNELFKKQYPEGFQPLDWRRVKAMLWVEVKGPDDSRDPNEWLVWPMQIGRRKGDPAMPVIKYGQENTDRYVPAELRDKLKHQRMTAELNIRAGVAYVYDRAIASWKNVWRINDPTERTYRLKPGDTLERLAKDLHTTVGELLQHNGLTNETAKSLQPRHELKYRLAEEVPQWRDWPTASFLYNSGRNDPDYGNKVERNYIKIKKKW